MQNGFCDLWASGIQQKIPCNKNSTSPSEPDALGFMGKGHGDHSLALIVTSLQLL